MFFRRLLPEFRIKTIETTINSARKTKYHNLVLRPREKKTKAYVIQRRGGGGEGGRGWSERFPSPLSVLSFHCVLSPSLHAVVFVLTLFLSPSHPPSPHFVVSPPYPTLSWCPFLGRLPVPPPPPNP